MGKVVAIITAGGSGKRLQAKIKKQFLNINRRPLIFYTLDKFVFHPQVDEIIIALPKDELENFQKEITQEFPTGNIAYLAGGIERQDSVFNALSACPQGTDIVLIHDGVRPFIEENEISELIRIARSEKAVIPVIKVKNTIKKLSEGKILKTVPREELVSALTPQAFKYELIMQMHQKAQQDNLCFTDDAAILEHYGITVSVLETSVQNIKITDAFDLKIAEILLK